jgi:isoleucyl-tRNA synthetase
MLLVDSTGADALRAYLINSPLVRAEPMRFSERGVRDTVRTVILPLWNAYNFLVTYARADGWSPTAADLNVRPTGALDRWILSRVQSFVGELSAEFDAYALSNCIPAFQRICDDLNNWYIRRGRRRYWRQRGEGDEAERDKLQAYATLFRVLTTVSAAIAPVIPFFSEWLFQRLVVDTGLETDPGASVHLTAYPKVDDALRDEALEASIAAVREAVAQGMAIREREKIAVRRPLSRVTVASPDETIRAALREHADDLVGELNVKTLEIVADDSALVSLQAKANFKLLGKRLGKRMKVVAQAVGGLSPTEIHRYLGAGTLQIGEDTLGPGDILVVREARVGQAAEAGERMTVVLDTEQNDELRREGLARELINRIQNLRKQAGFDVSARIELALHCDGEVATTLEDSQLRELIAAETLAVRLERKPHETAVTGEHHSTTEIDGEPVVIAVEKAEL